MIELNVKNIVHPKSFNYGLSVLRYVQVDFTSKCNAACLNCCGIPNQVKEDWPFEKAIEVLDVALGDLSMKNIFLDCNAEFSLYNYAIDVIDYIDDTFKEVTVHQDTNGIFIPEGFIERMNTIKNSWYDLSVSFWAGDEEDYRKYHGNTQWSKMLSNVRRLLSEIKNPRVAVRFSTPYINTEQFEKTQAILSDIVKETTGKNLQTITDIKQDTPRMFGTAAPAVAQYARNSFQWCDVTEPANLSYGPVRYFDENGEKKLKQLQVRDINNNVRPVVPFYNNCPLLNTLIFTAKGDVAPCLGTDKLVSLGNVFGQKVTLEWLENVFNSEERKREIYDNCYSKEGAFSYCKDCTSRISY